MLKFLYRIGFREYYEWILIVIIEQILYVVLSYSVEDFEFLLNMVMFSLIGFWIVSSLTLWLLRKLFQEVWESVEDNVPPVRIDGEDFPHLMTDVHKKILHVQMRVYSLILTILSLLSLGYLVYDSKLFF
jgi:hypothetical protein